MPRSALSKPTDRPTPESHLTDAHWPADAGSILLPLARSAIAERLGSAVDPGAAPDAGSVAGDAEEVAWLHEQGASFVTLHIGGRLRGCIGTISAYRSIAADVTNNARNAAFRDPRFPALSADEYADLSVEVSLLSPAVPVDCQDDADLLAQLRPGVDGVLIEAGDKRGTFLPQVWEQLPDPKDFLAQLKAKAGLRGPCRPDWRVSRYAVTAWSEG